MTKINKQSHTVPTKSLPKDEGPTFEELFKSAKSLVKHDKNRGQGITQILALSKNPLYTSSQKLEAISYALKKPEWTSDGQKTDLLSSLHDICRVKTLSHEEKYHLYEAFFTHCDIAYVDPVSHEKKNISVLSHEHTVFKSMLELAVHEFIDNEQMPLGLRQALVETLLGQSLPTDILTHLKKVKIELDAI